MLARIIHPLCLAALLVIDTACADVSWRTSLREQLPLLGHRNWIVVVDSAYPLQTSPGIETIYVDSDHLTVVKNVLEELAQVNHVRPAIFTDAELPHVTEKRAPGIEAYRKNLSPLLANQTRQSLPHEEIIAMLEKAGQSFKVLLIKTPLKLPYTSVFMRLECGYWSDEAENELRAMMNPAK